MKKVFLLMVVSGLLVTLGFAQTPVPDTNAGQANVKGCLGGSDGNLTFAKDGTLQIFKIITSGVDLTPHLGHDVNLIGHKASGATSSGTAENSFAVTELSMISDHCAAAAVAPPATASSPSSETVSPPPSAASAAATVSPSAETVSPPAAATTPAATVSPSSETVSPPAAATTAAAAVSRSSATVSTPPADAAQPPRRSARAHSVPATETAAAAVPAATASPSSDAVIPAAADTTTPAPTANASSETVSPPAAAATAPTTAPTVTHRSGSLFLLILVAVLVVVLGTLVPVFGRWRRRKMLERTGTPNLSLTKEESSDRNKPAPRKAA